MIATRTRHIAACYSSRAGFRKKRLDACGHYHHTRETAQRCAKRMTRERPNARRIWRTETIVWFLFPKTSRMNTPRVKP